MYFILFLLQSVQNYTQGEGDGLLNREGMTRRVLCHVSVSVILLYIVLYTLGTGFEIVSKYCFPY